MKFSEHEVNERAKHLRKFSPWAGLSSERQNGGGEDFAKVRGFQPLTFAEFFPSPGKVPG